MSELRDFVAGVLQQNGAAVEHVGAEELDVLSSDSVRATMGWPELSRLSFGKSRSTGAIAVGLEGDGLERFERLLVGHGKWMERTLKAGAAAPRDPEHILGSALDLPNAVWRLQGQEQAITRLLFVAFRYTALSDEKREGIIWLGLNDTTGSALGVVVARLMTMVLEDGAGSPPDAMAPGAARAPLDLDALSAKIHMQLTHRIAREIAPFLGAMRRRLERDRARVYTYHEDLRRESLRRFAQLSSNGKADDAPAIRREELRREAIAREYRAKLDDLKRNYAVKVTVEWLQGLVLQVPVHRFNVLVRRRKKERSIMIDWHGAVRLVEPPLCEFGAGSSATRFACDEMVHLTGPEGQVPCSACGKSWCRVCFPIGCPRCSKAVRDG
jgi:hypothetical protein